MPADPPRATSEPGSHRDVDWEGVRLHVVSGKGGTGKTTVAAALAVALAEGGRRVLLAEVEGRQGIAPLFDVHDLGYAERRLATAGPGEVVGLSVEPKAALLEYLDLFYHLGRAGKVLERMGAVDFATTVAPGLRDVLLTGKVYEAARRRREGRHVYDAVVLDAPPTGRIARFLNVNAEVAGLARMGPVRNQAESIMTLLQSPATVVHLVTVLEEMPVQETADAVAELAAADLPLGGIVVNQVRPPLLPRRALAAAARGSLDRDELAGALRSAGLARRPGRDDLDDARFDALVSALVGEAAEHGRRNALERAQRERLARLSRPRYELPSLVGGIDRGAVWELAALLCRQGMA